MLVFANINLNPKHRRTGDCSTRALMGVLNIEYKEALKLQYEFASKKFYGLTDKETIGGIVESLGYIKMKQPRKEDGKKYQVRELDTITSKEDRNNGVLVSIANHWVCVRQDFYLDIWDSGDYTIGNYWVKR